MGSALQRSAAVVVGQELAVSATTEMMARERTAQAVMAAMVLAVPVLGRDRREVRQARPVTELQARLEPAQAAVLPVARMLEIAAMAVMAVLGPIGIQATAQAAAVRALGVPLGRQEMAAMAAFTVAAVRALGPELLVEVLLALVQLA